jgi:Dockerin type I domain
MTRTFINTIALSALLATASHADPTATTIPLPGGTSAVGAYTLASVYGQSTSLGTSSASSVVLSPGFLCIEADDIGNPGDLNNDAHVNGVDLAIVLNNWGICGSGACPADIDRDGVVNGVDLAIVLSNWG